MAKFIALILCSIAVCFAQTKYTVKIEGSEVVTQVDAGQSLEIIAPLLSGEHFVQWNAPASGTIADLYSYKTTFTPTNDVTLSFLKNTNVKAIDISEVERGISLLQDSYFYPYPLASGAILNHYGAFINVKVPSETIPSYVIIKAPHKPRLGMWERNNGTSHANFPTQLPELNQNNTYYYSTIGGTDYTFSIEPSDGSPENIHDSVYVSVQPSIQVKVIKNGFATVQFGLNGIPMDASKEMYYLPANSAIQMFIPNTSDGSQFPEMASPWKVKEGDCTILNPNARNTFLYTKGTSCTIEGNFKPFPITTKPTTYYPDSYTTDNVKNGIKFYFTPPQTGGYAVTITRKASSTKKLDYKRSSDANLQLIEKSEAERIRYEDSLFLEVGDTVYYRIFSHLIEDANDGFIISYAPLQTQIVTLTSSSPNCSTSVSSVPAYIGEEVTVFGYAKEGFRPNGWKLISGTHRFSDSTATSLTDTISENTTLQLQCKAANLITIGIDRQYYSSFKDFYEVDSTHGMRFRYIAPTKDLYVIRATPQALEGTFNFYNKDASLSSIDTSQAINVNPASYFIKANKIGDAFYFGVDPKEDFYHNSVGMQVLPASIVTTEGKKSPDTIAIGDLLPIEATIESGYNFVNWYVESGNGSFIDSTAFNTSFQTKSVKASVKIKTRKLSSTVLTDKFKTLNFYTNSVQNDNGLYAIRTTHTANATGMYVIITQSLHSTSFIQSDSSFAKQIILVNSPPDTNRILAHFTKGVTYYMLFAPVDSKNIHDDIMIKVVPTLKVNADTSGTGKVHVGEFAGRVNKWDFTAEDIVISESALKNDDSTAIAGDSVRLQAFDDVQSRFSHWEHVSGNCTISDSTQRITYVTIQSNCKVKAVFAPSLINKITATPTPYTTAQDYYAGGPTKGMKFTFVAPEDGTYAIVVSRDIPVVTYFKSYTNSNFNEISQPNGTNGNNDSSTVVYERTYKAGETAYIFVNNSSNLYYKEPIWISYSSSKAKLTLTAGPNGTVDPTNGYDPAWTGAKYSIRAYGLADYRFSQWKTISGSPTIDNSNSPNTLASIRGDATIQALFEKSALQKLSSQKKQFNFAKHYYSESTRDIRFTWTAGDSEWHVFSINPADEISAVLYNYGTDSTFTKLVDSTIIEGTSNIVFQGNNSKANYWALKSSINIITNKSFTAYITSPYVVTIANSSQGFTQPSKEIIIAPGTDTTITAKPYGGYTFQSWHVESGTIRIDNFRKAQTRITPKTSKSTIRANYVIDFTVIPELSIMNLDLSNYPGICAQLTVTDKNNGRSIFGLSDSDFILQEDKKSLPVQASKIQEITGISVVLVVDESGSMGGTRITQAKNAIHEFIKEMGPYDRTSIVGFSGGSNAFVRQAMTSDTVLLNKATENLVASGNTNINTGTQLGINQVIGETNPTAVIVFSDGQNGSENTTYNDVIKYANSLNTPIHTIAIGTTITDPLLPLAEGTGGTYTYTPSADQLTEIYSTIRSAVQARYMVCYQSPDTTSDGDIHIVKISTSFNGKVTDDTASWHESFMPPSIELTKKTRSMIGESQPEGDSLVIEANVTSASNLSNVLIFIRPSSQSNQTFINYKMVNTSGKTWRYVLPASQAVKPGIDFYIVATDVTGLIGRSPAVPTPSKEPYTIPIGNDAPNIEWESQDCIDTLGGSGTIAFKIKDDDGIQSATLFYKSVMSVIFSESAMDNISKNTWTAHIPSNEFEYEAIEFYVRATDKNGTSARWYAFSNEKVSACKAGEAAPDVKDVLKIANADEENAPVTRSTRNIHLQLVSQNFTPGRDTVKAKLYCLVSGDVENSVKLVETGNGIFQTPNSIPKNERTPKKDNGSISCSARDTLIAEFKDPVYSTYTLDTVIIDDRIATTYQFLDPKNPEILDSAETSKSLEFRLRVTAESPTLDQADTLKVTLFTQKGDSLKVSAVETGAYTSIFEYIGEFFFVEDETLTKDSQLDAVFDINEERNRIKIQASTDSDKSALSSRDSLIVFSNYVPANLAEIYDRDLDGQADSVRIHFLKPLKKNIQKIDSIFWNKAKGTFRNVAQKRIHISRDGYWAEAQLDEPFEYGKTEPDSKKPPYLRFTKTSKDFSQKLPLEDKVGPVPAKAVKRPGQVSMKKFLEPETVIPPDTLVVTLSEGVQNTGKKNAWKDLFRYSETCEDSTSHPVQIQGEPRVDSTGTLWRLVLDDYSIMVGYCIKTNPSATYMDKNSNTLGRGGVELTGKDGSIYLYEVTPNPPVAGIGKKVKWIPPKGKSWKTVPDTLSTIKISTIAPFKANVIIYDGQGDVVTSFKREFGYHGEMLDEIRGTQNDHAKLAFIEWNQRSDKNRRVGTGVYIWRIDFKFKDGHSEYRILKTGIKRNAE